MAKTITKRTPEAVVSIAVLCLADNQRSGSITIAELRKQLPTYIRLGDEDLLPSPSRKKEDRWEQVLRNVISHRTSKSSIFKRGYATYGGSAVKITQAGRDYLKAIGV